uniref:Uncharacterized protein n=1 Tax=Heterorhabditis bacteriophora TaxID=37862 RepID=A0A1I7WVX8_HETBA
MEEEESIITRNKQMLHSIVFNQNPMPVQNYRMLQRADLGSSVLKGEPVSVLSQQITKNRLTSTKYLYDVLDVNGISMAYYKY